MKVNLCQSWHSAKYEGYISKYIMKYRVAVPGINGGDPLLDLHGVRVALLHEPVGQLRQQAHALPGLARHAARRRRGRRAAPLLRLLDPFHCGARWPLKQSELLTLLQTLFTHGPVFQYLSEIDKILISRHYSVTKQCLQVCKETDGEIQNIL